MVVLRVVERRRVGDLGRDRAVALRRELALVHLAGGLGGRALLGRVDVDQRAVLRADVVPLAHALGRVVALPEDPQHLLVARLRRVEDGEHDLDVAGAAGADLLVGRLRHGAARVAGRRRPHARRLPEHPLGAPEAAHAEHRALVAVGERRLEVRAQHCVRSRSEHADSVARLRPGLRSPVMSVGQESTITRGFLFADLRGYTDFVEQRGAAAAAALLTQYRALAREAIGQFGGAEIKTEGDSFYVVFDSVSSAVRCGLAITTAARTQPTSRSGSVSAFTRARRSRPTAGSSGHPSTSPRGSAPRPARARSWSARPSGLSRRPSSRSSSSREADVS